jgi:UPF0755 protein
MKIADRILVPVVHLWLAGVLVLLCAIGYCAYGTLWLWRFVQTRKIAFSIFILVLGICVIGCGALTVKYFLYPWRQSTESVIVRIPKGVPVRAIADSLYKHRVITARTPFLLWIRWSQIDRKIQAGRYVFFPGEGVFSASKKLPHAIPDDIVITIPEGLTVEQTAARIAAILPIDTMEFAVLCRDPPFLSVLGFGSLSSLEGYLFPDTYRFLESASCRDIIRRMTETFSGAYARLDSRTEVMRNFSRHQIVTLASIVEKEATLAAERPRIAGVFFNRLRLRLPLGADPTVRYIFKKFNGPLYQSELRSASPYNTRRYAGLPPGPICSPGFASLAATVSPLKTNELFFVARWDGSGAHEFSVTNEDHSRKKMLIRRMNKKRLQKKEKS